MAPRERAALMELDRDGSRASAASACCSPSTTWARSSPTPTACWCWCAARSSRPDRRRRCGRTRACARSISARAAPRRRGRRRNEARCRCRARSFDVDGLDAFYGRAQVLFDVSLRLRGRRGRGADGPQRRRQVHDPEGHHGPGRRRAPAAPSSRAARSRGLASYRIARARPRLCAGGPAHLHRPHRRSRTWRSAASRRGPGAPALDARAPVPHLPEPRRDAGPRGRTRCRAASSRCSPSPAP